MQQSGTQRTIISQTVKPAHRQNARSVNLNAMQHMRSSLATCDMGNAGAHGHGHASLGPAYAAAESHAFGERQMQCTARTCYITLVQPVPVPHCVTSQHCHVVTTPSKSSAQVLTQRSRDPLAYAQLSQHHTTEAGPAQAGTFRESLWRRISNKTSQSQMCHSSHTAASTHPYC